MQMHVIISFNLTGSKKYNLAEPVCFDIMAFQTKSSKDFQTCSHGSQRQFSVSWFWAGMEKPQEAVI